MKFISWNVNGLRACETKGFSEIFKQLDADFFCLQETKMQAGQLDMVFEGYESYWNYADKKGYSGTAIFTKHKPLNVTYGIGIDGHRVGQPVEMRINDVGIVVDKSLGIGCQLLRLMEVIHHLEIYIARRLLHIEEEVVDAVHRGLECLDSIADGLFLQRLAREVEHDAECHDEQKGQGAYHLQTEPEGEGLTNIFRQS